MPRIILTLFALVCLGLLPACASAPKHHAVPEALASEATVYGLTDIRFWGDELPPDFDARLEKEADILNKLLADRVQNGGEPVLNMLAMSAGGADGAFGAGLLVGWSAAGTRPQFDMVTGVSTGALAAPFVFLGPEYDNVLKEAYTTITKRDIYKSCFFCVIFGGPAFAKTKPLQAMIRGLVTPEVFAEIAREHRTGRALWIATTNLDAGRPVIWDIGALANSGHPEALALFHDILLASSAVPGLFPPVQIAVEAGGETYDELHVDGGTTTLTFLYPPEVSARDFFARLGFEVKPSLYVILNTRVPPQYEAVETDLFAIAERSLSTAIRYKEIGDALRIYEIARRDGIDFNLAIIPRDFTLKSEEDFDQAYMNALFDFAYDLSNNGYLWLNAPPGIGHDLPVE